MNKTLNIIGLALLAAVPAASAQTTTFGWTETGSSYGDASGTLTIDSIANGADSDLGQFSDTGYDYAVTGMTGAFTGGYLDGLSILPFVSGELNLSSSTPSTSVIGANLYFGIADEFPVQLVGGTVFSPGNPYTLFSFAYGQDAANDTFTLSPLAPVPESPLNPALVAAAGLFIGWRSLRKTLKTETLKS